MPLEVKGHKKWINLQTLFRNTRLFRKKCHKPRSRTTYS